MIKLKPKLIIKMTGTRSKKKAPPPKQDDTPRLSLKTILDYLDNLPNSKESIRIWKEAIVNIVFFSKGGSNNPDPRVGTMTVAELAEYFTEFNLYPILTDFEKADDIIINKTKNKKTGEPLNLNTHKNFYLAILTISYEEGKKKKEKLLKLDTETYTKYEKKFRELHEQSHKERNQSKPKKANLLYPEFDWLKIREDYEKFLSETAFTNTAKGRKDLRNAVLTGLYVLQTPRRVKDYATLQYYSKEPAEKERNGKNIIVVNKDQATLYIDEFKTRWKVGRSKTKKGEKREVLPQFKRELDPKLASLFRDYIRKWGLKDNYKSKEGYFVFHKETGDQTEAVAEGGFSKYISSVFYQVFKKKELSVNTFRHAFKTWLMANNIEFPLNQLLEFVRDFGDKHLLTSFSYRFSNQANAGKEKTEIFEDVVERNRMLREVINQGALEEEGSVGVGGGEDDDAKSPNTAIQIPDDMDEMLSRLMELEREKWKIILALVSRGNN